ncbi:MAG: hypothetical protein ABI670_12770 [Chloroflexota bacterium]
MLRRLFRGKQQVAEDPEVVIPGAKQGGHGDHWGCILRSLDEGRLIGDLTTVTQKDDHPVTFGNVTRGLAFRSEEGPVRSCVLVVKNTLASAYPEIEDGAVWPVLIREVIPWANGIEGQISGVCYGAAIQFFDTRFYASAHNYRVGETYNFKMGALAYTIGHAPETEAASDIGASISFKGASAFMPASTSGEGADIDDYWFHSPLNGEVTETSLFGQRLRIYPIILAIPSDFEMHLPVFAADHVVAADMELARVEDDLQGYLWLQGHLAEDPEETEE